MAAPGWFKNVFHQFARELADRSMRGEESNVDDAATDLWMKITGHSEKQLAKALEEVLGAKELPVMLQGQMVHRVHVDRIAKYLVHRGTVLDEEPDLFPAPLDQSYGAEGMAYRMDRDRPTYFGAGRRPGHINVTDAVRERERANELETERFLRDKGKRVGFVDDEGHVR
jgi:hypothetical protein